MKILIAVELPKLKDPCFYISKYESNNENEDDINLTKEDILTLQYGTIISFPGKYIKIDRNHEEFIEAEFHGVLEK